MVGMQAQDAHIDGTDWPAVDAGASRDVRPVLPPIPASARLVLAVMGLGVLFGLMWSSRNTGSSVAEWQVFLARFTTMVAFVACALAFRDRLPDVRGLLLVAGVCVVAHVGCDLLGGLMQGASELMALGAVSMVFEGAGVAVMQLLFLEVLTEPPVRTGIVGVVVAYVVAELVYLTLLFIPADAVPVVVRMGEILMLALLAWLRLADAHERDVAGEGAPAFASDAETTGGPVAASMPASRPTSRAADSGVAAVRLGGAPLAVVLAFIACLTLAWGLFAQMTGEGAHAFFDTTSEIIMVAVRLVLVVLCVQVGATVSFDRLAVGLSLLWATGILVVGGLWGVVAPATSALVLKAGLYALQAFSLVLVIRVAAERPERFYYMAGLVLCALMSAHVSRLAMLLLFANEPVAGGAVVGVLGVAAWLVACALAVPFVETMRERDTAQTALDNEVARRGEVGEGPIGGAADAQGFSPEGWASDAVAVRAAEFYRRFDRFCETNGLPERERDVLLETLHGYTVDAAAERLCLSRETVKTYLSRTYARAGVGGRQELLALLDRDEG